MTIKILDSVTRKLIYMTSSFVSLIWTERFREYGDFELEVILNEKNLEMFKHDRYLQIATSSNLMIIEKLEIKDDILKVSGRSLESLLDRRVCQEEDASTYSNTAYMLYQTVYGCFAGLDLMGKDATAKDENRLVDYVQISREDRSETMSNKITPTKLNGVVISRGDNLYSALCTLLAIDDVGFKMEFVDAYNSQYLVFLFKIYNGVEKNITFSENTFTLKDSSYKESTQNLKTTAYVAGQGEGLKRTVVVLSKTDTIKSESGEKTTIKYTGINRREMWVDARDLQKISGEKNAAYKLRLKDRGIEKMIGYVKEYSADGTIFNTDKYILKKDYDLGDIVYLKSKSFNAKAKITEIIQSWSSSGYSIYPSFKITEIEAAEIETSYNLG